MSRLHSNVTHPQSLTSDHNYQKYSLSPCYIIILSDHYTSTFVFLIRPTFLEIILVRPEPWKRTFPDCYSRVSTGQMPFLSPNQKRTYSTVQHNDCTQTSLQIPKRLLFRVAYQWFICLQHSCKKERVIYSRIGYMWSFVPKTRLNEFKTISKQMQKRSGHLGTLSQCHS